MELLAKFDTIEIKTDLRISEADREFCTAHQNAYEAAQNSLLELLYFWEDILKAKISVPSSTASGTLSYFPSDSILQISSDSLRKYLESIHDTFVTNLADYFSHHYHITISTFLILRELLPQEPQNDTDYKSAMEAYKEKLLTLSLDWNQIVDQIFLQFDGRGLTEQALHELKEKCHNAAWNTYRKICCYERKKRHIRFTNFACRYKDWHHCWEMNDGMKNILTGIAHFETDSFSLIPDEISFLINNNYIHYDVTEFSTCKKVQQIRLYKNGRADNTFSDESLAKKFVEDYLGTVC